MGNVRWPSGRTKIYAGVELYPLCGQGVRQERSDAGTTNEGAWRRMCAGRGEGNGMGGGGVASAVWLGRPLGAVGCLEGERVWMTEDACWPRGGLARVGDGWCALAGREGKGMRGGGVASAVWLGRLLGVVGCGDG